MLFKNRMLNAKNDQLQNGVKSKLESKTEHLHGRASSLTLIEILLQNFKNKLNESRKQWSGFDMVEIRAQLDTFIIAVIDTQSTALTYLLYHLAKYPNHQEQIYQEISQLIGNDLKHELTLNETKQFKLLDAFINESMRIKPVIPLISRNPSKDFKLDDKYIIPAGTDIVILIAKILNDPDYFPEPHVFKPERFLGENQTDNLWINIPFSGGVRNCVAKRIAMHVNNFICANLIRHYKIEFTPLTPEEIAIKFELANKPKDEIELRFVQRN